MTDRDELVERVAELQLAAFLAGRGSVRVPYGTRACSPAPTMDEFRAMARAALAATPLAQMREPEWFYLAGDMSSDRCRFSPSEVIDEDWLYDNRGVGTHVVQIECATPCPDIWCVVHFFTDAEKDARQSDDDYEIREFATEAAARAAITGEAP